MTHGGLFVFVAGLLLAVSVGVVIGVLTGLVLLVAVAFCRHG